MTASLARHLANWYALNDRILESSLEELQELMALEQAGKARKMFLLRIHSRINKLRAQAERHVLRTVAKS